jgi:hypothetical protein
MPAKRPVVYQRDVPATLVVRLATGEEWDATDDDLARFARPLVEAAYYRMSDAVLSFLTENGCDTGHKNELTATALNPIRYLAETVIYFDFDPHDHLETRDRALVAALDHGIRALFATDEATGEMHGRGPDLFDPYGAFEHVTLRSRAEHLAEAQRLLATRPSHMEES